jgi:hypothetical protein
VVGAEEVVKMKNLGAWGNWEDDGPYFIEAICGLEEANREVESILEDTGPEEMYRAVPARRNAVVVLIHPHEMYCPCKERIAKTVYEFWLEENEDWLMEE